MSIATPAPCDGATLPGPMLTGPDGTEWLPEQHVESANATIDKITAAEQEHDLPAECHDLVGLVRPGEKPDAACHVPCGILVDGFQIDTRGDIIQQYVDGLRAAAVQLTDAARRAAVAFGVE